MTIRSLSFGLCAAIAGMSMLSTTSTAQSIRNHDSNAPVDFAAGSMELQDRADRVVLAGGVTATQAGLTLKANRVTAAYSDNGGVDINRLDATGGVTITSRPTPATRAGTAFIKTVLG